MNTLPSFRCSLRLFAVLLLLLSMGTGLNAQPFKRAYPSLSLVSQTGGGNQVQYRLDKAGTRYQIDIVKQSAQRANFTIKTQAAGTVASGSFQTQSGGGKTIQIDKTGKGLLDLLQFTTDRVQVQNEKIVLVKSNENLLNCIVDCSKLQLLEDIQEDNRPTAEAFYTNNRGQGQSSSCDGYIPCSIEVLSEYDECVNDCLTRVEKQ